MASTLTALGPKEAECELWDATCTLARKRLAMLETTTGEVVNLTLMHEGNAVREFYSELPRPVLVGIEATGSMHWFLNLMGELGIECRVGHPATIRAAARGSRKMIGSMRTCF